MGGQEPMSGQFSDGDAGSAAPPRNPGGGAVAGPGRAYQSAERVGVGDDVDDGYSGWLVREMEAGRLLPPPESAIEGPAVSVSLGDACDVDPELLAAVCGPDGLGGQAAFAAFGEGKAADTLRPGPVLAALTAQAVSRVVPGPGSRSTSRSGSPSVSRPGPPSTSHRAFHAGSQSAARPTSKPVSEPAVDARPAAEPAARPVPQSATQSAAEPAACPVAHPAAWSAAEPASCPVPLSAAEPAACPVAHPAAWSAAEPAACPVAQPAAWSAAEPAACPVAQPACLTNNELIGVLQAARRLENLAAYQQTVVIAEFARRRQAELGAARAAGKPVGCRDGEFPGEELAMELVASGPYASGRIDAATELTTRLPLTLAGMENGTIDLARACAIASRTMSMTDADAAYADAVLAAAAPGLRLDQLARKAEALEKKLAPEAVKARRELAKQLGQRVEARREDSGNACLAGRELDTAEVIASKANIDALAARLRGSGMIGGTIGQLRAMVLLDLTQSRNPLDRITPHPAPSPAVETSNTPPGKGPGESKGPGGKVPGTNDDPSGTASGSSPEPGDDPFASPDDPFGGTGDPFASPGDPFGGTGDPADGHDDWADPMPGNARVADGPSGGRQEDGPGDSPRPSPAPGGPAPLPALINLLVPAGTLLGWGTAPAQATGWGLLDADETKTLVQAAAQHPRTRWCMTVIAPDGTAIAHGCAAGRHPWPGNGPPLTQRPPGSRLRPDPPSPHAPETPSRTGASQPPRQAAQLLDLLRRLNITLEPIARDSCAHTHAEDHYVPSRKLRHLIHARTQLCSAPACNAQACLSDLDHTIPYPDGPTDECNVNPKCRRHHRTKQAPGWQVAQPAPDTARWTTPSGRSHTTTPTVYDL